MVVNKKPYVFNTKLFLFVSAIFIIGSYIGGFIPKETWPDIARNFWPGFCCAFGGVIYFISIQLLNMKNKS